MSQTKSPTAKGPQLCQLSEQGTKSLELLAFFYYQIEQYDSSIRTLNVVQLADPQNSFAQNMRILLADATQDYQYILTHTEDLPPRQSLPLDAKHAQERKTIEDLWLLRARALQKLKRGSEATQLLKEQGFTLP